MDTLELSLGETGVIGLVNGSEKIADLAALQLRNPDVDAAELAKVAGALGPSGYDPIIDPDAYAALTRARIENEDPTQPWRPGVVRIRDFGIPDFAAITPPQRDGNTLSFFARDTHTGLPYAVSLPLGSTDAIVLTPMPLLPTPEPPAPVPAEVRNADASVDPVERPEEIPDLDDEDDGDDEQN